MARNQMKFRCVVYLIIAIGSLFLSIPLTKVYGGLGCAVSTAMALLLGQGLIMNIYYKRTIHLDITGFWKEIGKMTIAPLCMCMLGYFVLNQIEIYNISTFVISVLIFSLIYLIVIWRTSMNCYERNLFKVPVTKLLSRF